MDPRMLRPPSAKGNSVLQTRMMVVKWRGGTTATWTVRDAESPPGPSDTPVIVVPGGPGLPHDYLSMLTGLVVPGRPVVLYDPAGCGMSQPNDDRAGRWDLALFVDELAALVERFAADGQCHVLGHSSGGWVALEAFIRDPSLRSRVARLVLASAPLDVPEFRREQARLVDDLGGRHRHRLRREPPSGRRRAGAYWHSFQEFAWRHICRPPWPPELVTSFEASNRDVYEALWGPSEVWATGTMASWSCEDRLDGLTMPVLLTSGRFDEVTPALMRHAVELLPHATWRLFDESAHMPHVEQPDDYIEAVDAFLSG